MSAKKTSILGMALALAFALSALEQAIPPVFALPPGVKLGLSNVVVMYCVFFMGKKEAVALSIAKSGFALLTRGALAAFLSLCGGLASIFAIIILLLIFKDDLSYISASVTGAIMHNAGQLLALAPILGTFGVFYYFPALIISGVIMGCATGTLLKIVLPALRRMDG